MRSSRHFFLAAQDRYYILRGKYFEAAKFAALGTTNFKLSVPPLLLVDLHPDTTARSPQVVCAR